LIRGRTGRLDNENVAAANVLVYFDHHLAIREAPHFGFAETLSEMLTDFAGQRRVGSTCENFQCVFGFVCHLRFCDLPAVSPSRSAANHQLAGREGFEPSNARSKAWCLTSLATAQRVRFKA